VTAPSENTLNILFSWIAIIIFCWSKIMNHKKVPFDNRMTTAIFQMSKSNSGVQGKNNEYHNVNKV
jgi:hypothetical protein